VAVWPAQLGFWDHLAFQQVATKIGELELLVIDGGGPGVVGVPAVRIRGGDIEEDNGKAKT
jgi:hypothetical protein